MTNVQAPMTKSLYFSAFGLQPSAFITRFIKVPSGRRYLLHSRRGLTLVEVLIALTASLVLLGAVVSVLGMVSGSISDSRSMIESAGRLRSAQLLLRNDLAGATCNGLVWQKPEDNAGYIEIIEGTMKDQHTSGYELVGDSADFTASTPDYGDMLFMTVRSKDSQFSGRGAGGTVVKSNLAEVVWFLAPPAFQTAPGITTYNLHRRIFLIIPSTASAAIPAVANTTAAARGTVTADISFRTTGGAGGTRVPCTLGDLTNRVNRVFHSSAITPNLHPLMNLGAMQFDAASGREGEDIVLSNVIGFDIKVFDPQAEVDTNGLVPGDPGYVATGGTAVQRGAYVDLGSDYEPSPPNPPLTLKAANKQGRGQFGGSMNTKAKMPTTSGSPFVFDTWSTMYEYDGVDQDDGGSGIIDEGFNGLDDDTAGAGFGIVDDADERETSPPYPYPLRGIQIKIRIYEPNSGNVREVTVEESFMNR